MSIFSLRTLSLLIITTTTANELYYGLPLGFLDGVHNLYIAMIAWCLLFCAYRTVAVRGKLCHVCLFFNMANVRKLLALVCECYVEWRSKITAYAVSQVTIRTTGDEIEAPVLHRSSKQTHALPFDLISLIMKETQAFSVSDALSPHPRLSALTELPVYVITSM
jgi:hypothetical protein